MRKMIDLTGQNFGRLTVIKNSGRNKYTQLLWECKCDCGNIKLIPGINLTSGRTKSCGCLQKEMVIKSAYRRALTKEKGITGFNDLLRTYKRSAKKRDYEFKLTEKQFKELTQQNCYYCGTEPSSITYGNIKRCIIETIEWGKYIHNGIDRKDNNKGYTIENCVPCCKLCNRSKDVMSISEFLEHNEKICFNRIKKSEDFRKKILEESLYIK